MQNNELQKLRECPFCGGEATDWFCTANGLYATKFFGQMLRGLKAEHSVIVCNKCGCRTKVYTHRRNALKAWNKRVAQTPCDLCRFNTPSSMDGKPCTMCVADGRESDV